MDGPFKKYNTNFLSHTHTISFSSLLNFTVSILILLYYLHLYISLTLLSESLSLSSEMSLAFLNFLSLSLFRDISRTFKLSLSLTYNGASFFLLNSHFSTYSLPLSLSFSAHIDGLSKSFTYLGQTN